MTKKKKKGNLFDIQSISGTFSQKGQAWDQKK